MRKVLLLTLLSVCAVMGNAQLLTFDFLGTPGNQTTSASNSSASGVASSTISRGSGLIADANADRFNSSSFSTPATPAIDLSDYLEFTITPENATLTISSIFLQGQRSSTGPNQFVIRTSQDNYATNATSVLTTAAGNNVTFNLTFTFTNPIVTTSPITIRLYAFGATNGNGAFGPGDASGNDIVVNGSAAINSPLPVKFSSLKATKKGSGTELSFSNFTETNVVSYSIERSVDGVQFTSISQLKPFRNDGTQAEYNVTDEQPSAGVNFYRIKATETNGKVAYSLIVKINASAAQTGLTIFPNPVRKGSLNFQVTHLIPGAYTLLIRNATGQIVHKQSLRNLENTFSQTLPLYNLKSGVYYLELSGASKMSKQFIIE